ncbi:MAG: PKD domain-containing protein [Phycisphaerae bacterium]|nr:PKD domain-containing protein [Phycisphaerae bacterium]
MYNTGNRVYNNVFYGTDFAGISISPSTTYAFADNVIKNNILAMSKFVANDTRWSWYTGELDQKPVQLLCGRLDGFICQNNGFFADATETEYLISLGSRSPLVSPQQSIETLQATYPDLFWDNMTANPSFMNADGKDFQLLADSPMIDTGDFLTIARQAGSGNYLPVADVGYFYDGFNIPGQVGDLIRLEGQDNTARIINIDYENNILELSQSLSWNEGQGISLDYLGAKPDMGAYEFLAGDNYPPIAAFSAEPDSQDTWTFDFDASEANDSDGEIILYSWDFGDGSIATSSVPIISHTFPESKTYTVTLTITDNGNPPQRGTAKQIISIGDPALMVSATELNFGPFKKSATVELTNGGAGAMIYNVTTSASWLKLTSDNGTVTNQAETITVQVDRESLAVGNYSGTITVDAGVAGSCQINAAINVTEMIETNIINSDDSWNYFKGNQPPPSDWIDADCEDSQWLCGLAGIGYSNDVSYTTLLDDMYDNYLTVYMRREFSLEDLNLIEAMELGMYYDDGFIAYINGIEVARSNSMGAPGEAFAFDEPSIDSHDEEAAEEIYPIALSSALLLPGNNVLAIELHNVYIKSSDACAVPRLTIKKINGNPADINFDGQVTLQDFAIIAGQWLKTEAQMIEDLDHDGSIGISDLILFEQHWME